MNDAALTLVLWCATALVLGWTWIPALLAGLGAARFRITGSEDPALLIPDGSDPFYDRWHQRITGLGYEPLGPAHIQILYHGPIWRFDAQLRLFYSRAKQTFAFLQKQPRPMDVWSLAMFATCFSDGSLLMTSNAANEAPAEGDDDYVVQGMESDDLAAVEQLQLAARDRMRAAGKQPDRDGSMETFLAAARVHSAQAARFVSLKLGQTYLASHAIIHAILSVPAVYVNGFAHWSLPLVNLVLGSVLAGGEQIAKRRAGSMMRSQAQHQPAGERL